MVSLLLLCVLKSIFGTECGTYNASVTCTEAEGCEWIVDVKDGCTAPSVGACTGTTGIQCSSIAGCEWQNPTSGTCSGPLSSSCVGDSTTCETATNGCQYYKGKTECGGPSEVDCFTLSRTSCEASNSGCKWYTIKGTCDYPPTGYCEYLNEFECKSTMGCEYQAERLSCNPPDYEACFKLNASQCESTKLPCKLYPASGECQQACDKLGESECNAANKCKWNSDSRCRRSDCNGLSPTQCSAENSGCVFTPDIYGCSGPNSTECEQRSKANCNEGCSWFSQEAFCDYSSCDGLSKTECKDGCIWFADVLGCIGRDFRECRCLGESECSANSSGCKWDSENLYCDTDASNCTTIENACTDEAIKSKCRWGIFYPGSCIPDFDSECENNIDDTACNEASGCVWKREDGVCMDDGSLNCNDNGNADHTATGCAPDADSGCVKRLLERKRCEVDPDYGCYPNENQTDCDYNISDSRCAWSTNGYCENLGEDCYSNADNTGCLSCSSASVCEWIAEDAFCSVDAELYATCKSQITQATCTAANPKCSWRSEPGKCVESDAVCYDNTAKTNCDEGSDSVCKWQTGYEACGPDGELICSSNQDGTCVGTASSGCRPKQYPAQCGVSYSLYCVANSSNNGCNMTVSDAGCEWKAGSGGSCKPYENQICVNGDSGSECSTFSALQGCVWGKVGECRKKADKGLLVVIPSLSFLVLVLFMFL